ncbi:uridine nucleosidase [Penicillium odoratum]|uniref:uridine nucleosidase n=1 Tax=Penicillium odoratum TaxID=1167516 RepID=UPI002547B563|nr:uridine nucleosidase [Penicillium odoratum]KAJ5771944.1 uridine nucleosidase [Penicillium odoratum]
MLTPTTSPKTPLWLDCDPGHDDVFAILLAAYHPGFDLLGISTVFGNAPLECTTRNAASVLTAIGKHNEIPLYPGASKAMARPTMHPPTGIHGKTGLDGTELLPNPRSSPRWEEDAVEAMATALLAQPPGTAFLVATGSLTNVAILFRDYPHVISHIKGFSMMGCAFGGFTDISLGSVLDPMRIGNYSQWAEFNILADPEAAALIFNNKDLAAKTTVIPLDLTHQVLATKEVRDRLLYGVGGNSSGSGKSTLRQMLVELLMFFADTYADVYQITAGPPLHDPLAVAVALIGTEYQIDFHEFTEASDSKQKERFSISIETNGSYEEAVAGAKKTGMSVQTKLPAGSKGVRIPRSLDISKFWTVLEECFQRADKVIANL